jgi:uncharacterized protein
MLRKLIAAIRAAWEQAAPSPTATSRQSGDRRMRISETAIGYARAGRQGVQQRHETYKPAPGVLPADMPEKDALAMDSTPYDYVNTVYGEDTHFRGYPYLAMLAQLPEYRKMSGTRAKEMTRRWIKLMSTAGEADDAKAEKIKVIEAQLKRHKVRDKLRRVALLDGFYGRGQIFIDVAKPGEKGSAREDNAEMKTPLLIDPAKITEGSLIGFNVIEPVWTYPSNYNSTDPTAPNFYKPHAWYVMGREIHHTRLLTFISREVPDLLKPAYNFGGLSLSQMAEPYVDNWLRTRSAVGQLVHSYSTSGIKTDLGTVLNGGDGQEMLNRAELYNQMRDNRGVLLLDNESEEFFQFNTPLSGMDALQAQAQEQMASVSSTPLVKLLGITPSGLNASSDGEIRVFYDDIHAEQEDIFADPLKTIIDVIQLDQFGKIDPDITAQFVPLWQESKVEQSTIRKTDADTDATLIGAGVISADEARQRIANDPDSGYHSIDLAEEIDAGEPDDDSSNFDNASSK